MITNQLFNITTAGTFTIKPSAGYLDRIIVNSTAAGTITIYDSLTATGRKIGTLKASVAEGTYAYNGIFTVGLTIVTSGASDITVSST